MKNCDRCGAANATRAQFCNACGAKFRIADAVAARGVDLEKKPRQESALAPNPRETPTGGGAFWKTAAALLSALWKATKFLVRRGVPALWAALRKAPAFFAALAVWIRLGWRKSRPLRARFVARAPRYGRAAWRRVRVALAPSATWTNAEIPNFLIWGVVDFFLWRFPFSIVGVFYAILANEAKRANDFDLARNRAANAKGWLLADLALGVFASLGAFGSFFLRALF